MAEQELRLDRGQVEPSTGLIHQNRQTRRGLIPPSVSDPLDRLLQADLEVYVRQLLPSLIPTVRIMRVPSLLA